jgi:hypothetical protein
VVKQWDIGSTEGVLPLALFNSDRRIIGSLSFGSAEWAIPSGLMTEVEGHPTSR